MAQKEKIVHIEKNLPHTTSEVIYVRCCERWYCVRPTTTLLKNIECTNCGIGGVIETGQPIDVTINTKP